MERCDHFSNTYKNTKWAFFHILWGTEHFKARANEASALQMVYGAPNMSIKRGSGHLRNTCALGIHGALKGNEHFKTLHDPLATLTRHFTEYGICTFIHYGALNKMESGEGKHTPLLGVTVPKWGTGTYGTLLWIDSEDTLEALVCIMTT